MRKLEDAVALGENVVDTLRVAIGLASTCQAIGRVKLALPYTVWNGGMYTVYPGRLAFHNLGQLRNGVAFILFPGKGGGWMTYVLTCSITWRYWHTNYSGCWGLRKVRFTLSRWRGDRLGGLKWTVVGGPWTGWILWVDCDAVVVSM